MLRRRSFYQEFQNQACTRATGNVIAIVGESAYFATASEVQTLTELQPEAEARVRLEAVSQGRWQHVRVIAESKARRLRPNLFTFIEARSSAEV